MAERKAQNKYIPPDFDWRKHHSVNAYRGSHHLRARASKLSEGILVVRFEMPYNVWCLHCGKHIGMGVRYNAEKKRVGMYLTTPVLEFKMTCHLCQGELVMHTDPQNATYTCVSGLRKKIEDWEPSPEETGQIRMESDADRKRLADDAFFRVEHQHDDAIRAKTSDELIQDLFVCHLVFV
jgi:coiled-coil domain-containing protein 130